MPSYEDVSKRVGSLLRMTGVTEQEFTALLPHVEQAYVGYLQDRTIDGQPRTSRRMTPYVNCPLPTMADKLLFILSYVKHNPIQEMQGQLFGMSQSNANKWIQLLHAVLNQALANQDLLPARTAEELTARLTKPSAEGQAPSPLVYTTGANDQSSGQQIQRSSKSITVGRRNARRSKTSS